MRDANKNANRIFLERFQGKAKKVGKTGMRDVLAVLKKDVVATKSQEGADLHLRKIDLDQLIPNFPNRSTNHERRYSYKNKLRPPLKSLQKKSYVPSAYSPHVNLEQSQLLRDVPSRSSSNNTRNSRGKYLFGKFLKLDREGLEHIDFLYSIEKRPQLKPDIHGNSVNST